MPLFYNYKLVETIHSSVESVMLVKLVHIFNKICAPHTRPIPTHQQGVRPVLCCSSGMQDVPSEAAHTHTHPLGWSLARGRNCGPNPLRRDEPISHRLLVGLLNSRCVTTSLLRWK